MSLVHTNEAQTLFPQQCDPLEERIFELVDREALASIAGTDRQATFPAPHLK
jgi:hypothetical protein